MFQINPQAKVSKVEVGHDKTQVCIIDNFFIEPEKCIGFVERFAHFEREEHDMYPGVRSPIDAMYSNLVMQYAMQLVKKVYTVPDDFKMKKVAGVYSLMTLPERALTPYQCIPHVDSTSDYHFAVMHYLNKGDFGGTAFYRHKPTGFETIQNSRMDEYNASVQAFVTQHGLPEQAYFKQSDAHFEEIDRIEYRANRLLIYPGQLLHSGLIDEKRDLSNQPSNGRLTANLFIDFVNV